MRSSRREFLKLTAGAVFGAIVGAIAGSAAGRAILPPTIVKEKEVEIKEIEKPITLKALSIPPEFRFDLNYVAERAFSGYKAVCCCFGSGDSIVGTLIDKLAGNPWDYLLGRGAYDPEKPLGHERYVKYYDPEKKEYYGFTGFYHFGCAGGYAWGETCGALTGADVALGHFFDRKTCTGIMDQVRWGFQEGPVPDPEVAKHIATVAGLVEGKDYIIVDKPGSTQCHAYVAKVTEAFKGIDPAAAPRKNTCGLLTSTVAVKLAKLINEQVEKGTITEVYALPKVVAECLKCHGEEGPSPLRTWGKQVCTACHKTTWKHP